MAMIINIIHDEIKIYKQCIEELQGEIEIIKSIFNAEHDHIMIHTETFPVVIELCLSSTNKIAKLYMHDIFMSNRLSVKITNQRKYLV